MTTTQPHRDHIPAGAYYVTFLTHGRRRVLGWEHEGAVKLSEAGEAVRDVWRRLHEHCPQVRQDALRVLPDGVECIVVLGPVAGPEALVGVAERRPGPPVGNTLTRKPRASSRKPLRVPAALAGVVRGLKSQSARRINRLLGRAGVPVWEEGYRSQPLRSEAELELMRAHIAAGPHTGC